MKNPMHPGEFILWAYMEPLNIQAVDLADRLDISPSTLFPLIMRLRVMKWPFDYLMYWVALQNHGSTCKQHIV